QLSPTGPVWFNWAMHHNAALKGYWADELLLDGTRVQLLPRWNVTFASKDWYALDVGPFFVRGGRHTVSAITDTTGSIEDYSFRDDNRVDRSLVWTPEPLSAQPGAITSFDPPPPPFPAQTNLLPNNHAFALPTPAGAFVVSVSSHVDCD